jgi:hypothetical protein
LNTLDEVAEGSHGRGESGAVLILALVYIISISLIVGALADWAMNSLNNTTHFQSANQIHTAVSGATNTAIHAMQVNPYPINPTYNATGYTTALGPCWSPGPSSTVSIDGQTVAVWCTMTVNLTSAATRTTTFYTCLSSVSATQCQANPLLQAVVIFDDYPSGGATRLYYQCNAPLGVQTCGEGQTLVSWTWG